MKLWLDKIGIHLYGIFRFVCVCVVDLKIRNQILLWNYMVFPIYFLPYYYFRNFRKRIKFLSVHNKSNPSPTTIPLPFFFYFGQTVNMELFWLFIFFIFPFLLFRSSTFLLLIIPLSHYAENFLHSITPRNLLQSCYKKI